MSLFIQLLKPVLTGLNKDSFEATVYIDDLYLPSDNDEYLPMIFCHKPQGWQFVVGPDTN